MDNKYTEINSKFIDKWAEDGWEWGTPISMEMFEKTKHGEWSMVLTPTKPVPRAWFPQLAGAQVLGLASGGAQQMPIFAALGAICTVMDYSEKQLASEREFAEKAGYKIETVRADMTKPLPFADETFDLIFHPVSNCYIKDVLPVWHECYRVLKPGGVLLAGVDNGVNYAFNDDETALEYKLPFDPLADEDLFRQSVEGDWGIQFSHTIEEQVGGQITAGLTLTDIYQDTNGEGNLSKYNVPTYFATRAVK